MTQKDYEVLKLPIKKENGVSLEDYIGKKVRLEPYKYLKRNNLFSSQKDTVDESSITLHLRARGHTELEEPVVKVLLSFNKKQEVEVTVFDGHHRVAIACLGREAIDAEVIGRYDREKLRRWPFKTFLREFRRLLGRFDLERDF